MGLNVGDTGTAEPGGKERLTGTHRRMVSRLLIEAKFNTALNWVRYPLNLYVNINVMAKINYLFHQFI